MEIINSLISSGIVSMSAAMFYGAGILGMIAHYIKKRVKRQTLVDFKDYFGKNNPLSSFAAFATFAGAMTGMVFGLDLTTLSTPIIIILGMACGWTIDSGINTVTEPRQAKLY